MRARNITSVNVSTTTTIADLTASEMGEVVPNGGNAEVISGAACLHAGWLMPDAASALRFGFVANIYLGSRY